MMPHCSQAPGQTLSGAGALAAHRKCYQVREREASCQGSPNSETKSGGLHEPCWESTVVTASPLDQRHRPVCSDKVLRAENPTDHIYSPKATCLSILGSGVPIPFPATCLSILGSGVPVLSPATCLHIPGSGVPIPSPATHLSISGSGVPVPPQPQHPRQ